MPELGKATYYLIVNDADFRAKLRTDEEIAAGYSASIGRSFDRATAATERLMVTAGTSTAKFDASMMASAGVASKSAAEISAANKEVGASGKVAAEGSKWNMSALGALGLTAYLGIKFLKQNAEANALLANGLRDTGASAHITRSELDALTSSEDKHSTFTRAEIVNSEQLSLRYRDVADKARFVKVAIDGAAVAHKSLQMVTLALGRALEDPAKGLTKLTRLGISFSPALQAMAKEITKTKGTAAGMAFVFAQVEKNVRGAAQSAANAQPWTMLYKQFGEISATIMKNLMPAFKAIVGMFAAHKTAATLLVGALLLLSAAYAWMKLATFAKTVMTTIADMKIWRLVTIEVTDAQIALNVAMDANPIGLLILAIAALVIGLYEAYKHIKLFRDLVNEVFGFIGWLVPTVVKGVIYAVDEMAYLLVKSMTFAVREVLSLASHLPFVGDMARSALSAIDSLTNAIKPNMTSINEMVNGMFSSSGTSASNSFGASASQNLSPSGNAGSAITNAAASTGNAAGTSSANAYAAAMAAAFQKNKTRVEASVTKIIDAVKAKVLSLRGTLTTAFTDMTTQLFQAFDAKTQQMVNSIATKGAQLTSAEKALNVLQARGAPATTPAEQALTALQDAHNQQQLQQSLIDAQIGLHTAQATGDPAQILSAQRTLADAQYNIQVDSLQRQAAAQRTAADAQYALQVATLQKQAAAQRAARDKETAAMQLNLQSQRDLYKKHLEKWLSDVQAWLQRNPKQWKQVSDAIMKVFGPDLGSGFSTASSLLGTGFVQGLMESIQTTAKDSLKVTSYLTYLSQRLGRGLAAGIVGGLDGLSGELAYRLYHEVYTAILAAKRALGISSPSQVTWETLGVPMGEGVVMGAADVLANQLGATLTGTIGAAIDAAHTIVSQRVSSIPGAATTAASGLSGAVANAVGGYSGAGYGGSNLGGPSNYTPAQIAQINANEDRQYGLGSQSATGVTVVQNIKRIDPDPHQLLHEARYAAEAVFG